jgi:hypothetical protein
LDRPGRRTRRNATKQLIAPHSPRHTHSSELKVISRRLRPWNFHYSVVIRFLIRTTLRRMLGNKDRLSPVVQGSAEAACSGLGPPLDDNSLARRQRYKIAVAAFLVGPASKHEEALVCRNNIPGLETVVIENTL